MALIGKAASALLRNKTMSNGHISSCTSRHPEMGKFGDEQFER